MSKDFDKELYVKQDFIAEFLKTHEPYYRKKQISIEESLTNFINDILDDRLKLLNDKCNTCDKTPVCKIWQDLIEKHKILMEKCPRLVFTAGILSCKHYQKKEK